MIKNVTLYVVKPMTFGWSFTLWTSYQDSAPTEPTGSLKRPPDPLPKNAETGCAYTSLLF